MIYVIGAGLVFLVSVVRLSNMYVSDLRKSLFLSEDLHTFMWILLNLSHLLVVIHTS